MIGKLRADAGKNRASARIVDGRLILSLPRAERPVVWQMDLTQTKSSALEIRQSENGSHILVLKTPRGETVEIAPFADPSDALEGLMAVTGAFENAHGHIGRQSPANDGSAPAQEFTHAAPRKKHGGKWLTFFLGAALIVILLSLWSTPTSRLGGTGTGSPATAGADPQASGVPVPADAFLQNR
jgi:hypothetical protein